jgi:hypothetical protein
MKFHESITDYATYWKVGKAREELKEHDKRKEQEQNRKNRYNAVQRSQRQAQGQAAAAIRPKTV